MIEQLVLRLARRAHREQSVVSQVLPSGVDVLAYPAEPGVLIGLGFTADSAHQIQAQTVLQRRSSRMASVGAWLPALFLDGSFYLVRRLVQFDPNSSESILSETVLNDVLDILS